MLINKIRIVLLNISFNLDSDKEIKKVDDLKKYFNQIQNQPQYEFIDATFKYVIDFNKIRNDQIKSDLIIQTLMLNGWKNFIMFDPYPILNPYPIGPIGSKIINLINDIKKNSISKTDFNNLLRALITLILNMLLSLLFIK